MLDNNTLVNGDFQAQQGRQPVAEAYGETTAQLFVLDDYTWSVFVVSASTDLVTSTVSVGYDPDAVASGYWTVGGSLIGAEFVANEGSNNVTVISDATDKPVASVPVGYSPDAVAYDLAQGEVFVANEASDNLSVLSDVTDKVVATAPVGSDPSALAYDSGMGEIFVANYGSDNASVVCDGSAACGGSSRANAVVATVAVGKGPTNEAYDPGTEQVFVADSKSNDTDVISDATNQVVGTWDFDHESIFENWTNWTNATPHGMVYDPGTGDVFVSLLANSSSDLGNVSVLATGPLRQVACVGVGYDPSGMAVASGGSVFVANAYSGNLSVISDVTDKVVGTVATSAGPTGIAYDPAENEVFVANIFGPGDVSAISDTTEKVVATVPVGSRPEGLAYDSGTGDVWVANYGSNNVSVISGATDKVVSTRWGIAGPTALAYDSGKGEMWVTSYLGNEVFEFGDSGGENSVFLNGNATVLAYDSAKGEVFVGIDWPYGELSVICDGSTACGGSADNNKVLTSQYLNYQPTGMVYDPGKGEVFVSIRDFYSPFTSVVDVVSDSTDGIVATIGPVFYAAGGLAYDAADGLVFVGDWGNVTAVSDATDTVVWSLPVGTPYYLAFDSVKDRLFVSNEFPGTVSVLCPQYIYTVDFNELGFPSGVDWWLDVTGPVSSIESTVSSTLVFDEPNGTYAFTAGTYSGRYEARGTEFTVSGSSLSMYVDFYPVTYNVTFASRALPLGTLWSVTVNGTEKSTYGGSITYREPNGTYAYAVSPVGGYTLSPNSGSLIVSGNGSLIWITFSRVTYPVTFTESGLLPGTAWSVGLNYTWAAVAGVVWTYYPGYDLGPSAEAYDPGVGELFVAEVYNDSVSVLNTTTGGVVANVPVGYDPAALAVDPGRNEVFVANYDSDNVSVISDTNDTVVATISVGISPAGLAYDAGTGQVFVANENSDNVSVISDTTNTVVATVPVGVEPDAVVYDPGQNELFVANYWSGNLSVISDTNDTVVNWLDLFNTQPDALAYDPQLGEVFVVGYSPGEVDVIAAAADLWVGTVAVPSYADAAVYDAGRGELFVASYTSDVVTVILPSTDAPIANVSVGSSPSGLAYVPAQGEVYVANQGSSTISVISDARVFALTSAGSTTDTASISMPNGTDAFTVSAPPEYVATPSAGNLTVDGAPVSEAVVFTLSSGFYLVTFTESGLPEGTAWSVSISGQPTVNSTAPTISTILENGTYAYTVASENRTFSASGGSFTVNGTSVAEPVPFAELFAAPSAGPDPTEVGWRTVVSAGASGGSGSYSTYAWSGLPSNCSSPGNVASFDCVPSAPGSYVVEVVVTDSNGGQVNGTFTLTVEPTLEAQLAASSSSIDVGQSSVLTLQFTGGVSPLTWMLTVTSSSERVVLGGTVGGTRTFTPSMPGTYTFYLTATDAVGRMSAVTATLTVDPALSTAPSAMDNPIDAGQTTTISAGASGGSGTYVAYVWSGLPEGCPDPGNVPSFRCTPSAAGPSTVEVEVTDSNGEQATETFLLTVSTTLVVPTPTLSATTVHQGQTTTISGTVPTTGTGPYGYQWLEKAPGAPGYTDAVDCAAPTTPTCTFATTGSTVTGSYSFELRVTDSSSSPSVSTSSPVTVTVEPHAFPLWSIGAVFAVTVVAIVAVISLVGLLRRRAKGPAASKPGGQQAGGSGGDAPPSDGGPAGRAP